MKKTWFQTAAIDYPNSRPHIGTAFEKLGADVQARYRRMEGYDVVYLMGNDENTLKVSKRAEELGQDPVSYCADMAKQFREVWDALNIQYDVFIQTSSERHKQCCRKFIQKVYDNGYIYKGHHESWYCNGCEEFKTEQQHKDNAGNCPTHLTPLVRRSEPCYFFAQSKFQERLLEYYEENPDFIQPERARNEIISMIRTEGLRDQNISRTGEDWGIRLPFDDQFTIYVWFDALLTYITGIGYGDDEATFNKYWPANVHVIGKDITRFHAALWPAMLWAAGLQAPKKVFVHGWITVDGSKMGKSMGNAVDPLDIVSKSSVDAYRYYFMRECPFPGDGDYSGQRFEELCDSELANKLGNLLSRCLTLISRNYDGVLENVAPQPITPDFDLASFRGHVEGFRYNTALQSVVAGLLTPADQYLATTTPWKLVKTDLAAAKQVLANCVEVLRIASIVLKPFIPTSAEKIYRSFSFATPWESVKYADAATLPPAGDLTSFAEFVDGKLKPLFPRITN